MAGARDHSASGPAWANDGAWWTIHVDAPDPIREYIYLGGQLLASLTLSTGTPVLTYYHTDALGSVRAVTDAAGVTLTRHDYSAFGEGSALQGDPRRFEGQELDFESGLDHFGAREYRNIWGRFTAVDPIFSAGAPTNPQLWNRYAYALNNPLRFTDANGLEPSDQPAAADYGATGFSSAAFADWVETRYLWNMVLDYRDGYVGQAQLLNALPLWIRQQVDPDHRAAVAAAATARSAAWQARVDASLAASGLSGFIYGRRWSIERNGYYARAASIDALREHLAKQSGPGGSFLSGNKHGMHADVGPDRQDHRSRSGLFGRGSMQIVTSANGWVFIDVDDFSPYQGVWANLGHVWEVIRNEIRGHR